MTEINTNIYALPIQSEISRRSDLENLLVIFGYGNDELETWFLTKTKFAFIPKGSKLLFKLGVKKTSKPISCKETYPTVGDIVSDMYGERFEIFSVDWA